PQHGGHAWGSAEYLLWWTKGQSLPPLVTTSPIGTPDSIAGVLGKPTTSIIYGNSRVNDDARSGGRFTLGYWFNDNQSCGIAADFFILPERNTGFAAFSTGNPIIARPFFNTLTQTQDAELIAFPGLVQGGVSVTTSSEFLGAGVNFRKCLCSGDHYRIEGLV